MVSYIMATAQEYTETPDWTMDEVVKCTKIISEIEKGEVKLYKLR